MSTRADHTAHTANFKDEIAIRVYLLHAMVCLIGDIDVSLAI